MFEFRHFPLGDALGNTNAEVIVELVGGGRHEFVDDARFEEGEVQRLVEGFLLLEIAVKFLAEHEIFHRHGVVEMDDVIFVDILEMLVDEEGISAVFVGFDKFPKGKALTESLVLHKGVGVDDGGADGVALHRFAESGRKVGKAHGVEFLHAAPNVKTVGVDALYLVLVCRLLEFHGVMDFSLHLSLFKILVVGEFGDFGVDGVEFCLLVAACHEHIKAPEKGVQELVFIGHHRLFTEDV